MMRIVIVAVLLLISARTLAKAPDLELKDNAPEVARKYAEGVKRDYPKHVKRLQTLIKDLKKSQKWIRMNMEGIDRSNAIKRTGLRIKELSEKLQDVRSGKVILPPILNPRAIRVGDVGAFAPTYGFGHAPGETTPRSGHVDQVISSNQVLITVGDQTLWIEGLSTQGLVDDGYVGLDIVLHISETKTYTTVIGGSRTVLYAEPFHIEPYLKKEPKDS